MDLRKGFPKSMLPIIWFSITRQSPRGHLTNTELRPALCGRWRTIWCLHQVRAFPWSLNSLHYRKLGVMSIASPGANYWTRLGKLGQEALKSCFLKGHLVSFCQCHCVTEPGPPAKHTSPKWNHLHQITPAIMLASCSGELRVEMEPHSGLIARRCHWQATNLQTPTNKKLVDAPTPT